jgi:hypothetical protein
VPNIVNPGENPDLENKIYNYLWLIIKALAIKKRMFQNFEDYDGYSFYAATRLFMAIRKNQLNQGKIVKGKLIKPIKSCLNYTKALLYPMKLEYQQESFREIIKEEFVSTKFDALAYKEQLKDQARCNSGVNRQFGNYLLETINHSGKILDDLLQKSPFNSSTPEYRNLKISILLTSIYALKNKKKLCADGQNIVLWHLPKSMSGYAKILLKEFFTALKQDIIDCYKEADIDETELDTLLNAAADEVYYKNEEQY